LRRLLHGACLVAVLGACGNPSPTAAPLQTSPVDATGILIVDVEEQVQAGPITRAFADPLEAALMLIETNPDDVGYPWMDEATGELVLSVATPRGRELIDAAGITVPHRIRDVAHSAAELQVIQDDVTFLGARGVVDADLIFMTMPDHRDNRTLIVMRALSRPLLEYLAEHYPVDAIAVQVDPTFQGAGPG
jgi:hypothetical protein